MDGWMDRMGWDGMGWDWVGWDGMGWDEMTNPHSPEFDIQKINLKNI